MLNFSFAASTALEIFRRSRLSMLRRMALSVLCECACARDPGWGECDSHRQTQTRLFTAANE